MIEFPADVTELNIKSVDKLYGDEFTIKPSQGLVDGKQAVLVELVGEQKEHKEVGVEGTVINIKADIKLNRTATSKQDTIKMTYTNGKAISYENGAENGIKEEPIEIVSPTGLITTNNIETLDIETIGEEKGVSKEIEIGSEEKVLNVNSEIINNNETAVNDVKILGTFGTEGIAQINGEEYESNINASLRSGLSIETANSEKIKIYYTENENATDNLGDSNNGWQEQITNAVKTRKYLLTVENMEPSEEVKVGYDISVPAGLQYNQQMYQGYSANYIKSEAQEPEQAQATIIELTTGEGPEVTTSLTARVGADTLKSREIVEKGEKIECEVEIENTGNVDIENAKFQATVPEGTTLLAPLQDNLCGEYNALEDREVNIDIPELKQGEKTTESFIVRVNKDAESGSNISLEGKVEYNENVLETWSKNLVVGEASGDVEVCVSYLTDEKVPAGKSFEILMHVANTTESDIENVETTWTLPDGFSMQNNRDFFDVTATENNSLEYKIDKIESGETAVIIANVTVDENVGPEGIYEVTGTAEYKNKTYRGNIGKVEILSKDLLDVQAQCDKDGQNVKVGDFITYTVKMKNKRNFNISEVTLQDTLPTNLMLREISVEDGQNATQIAEKKNNFTQSLIFGPNEEKTITLKAEVVSVETLRRDLELVNSISLINNGETIYKSKDFISTIKVKEEEPSNPTDPENPDNPENPENPENPDNPVNPNIPDNPPDNPVSDGKISGYAWIDTDQNGAKDDYENTVENMPIKLLNIDTNEVVNTNAVTDSSGYYSLQNIPEGRYIVAFEYDATQYSVTEYQKAGVDSSINSKAISNTLNIDGEEKIYGITDIISVTSEEIPNINIGLITTGAFDLKLDKYISKITINTVDGVETHNYNNETLAKVELSSRKIEGANVIIEYDVVVTNEGEVAGYATSVKDKMPTDLSFSSELNSDWHEEGNALVSNNLGNQIILPGESKTLKLVLTKTMTQTNTGITTNTAEIQDSYNNNGTEDTDTTPGNGVEGEDDIGSADVIISIKTGGTPVYTTLIIMIAMIGTAVAYMVRNEMKLQEIEDEIFRNLM